MKRLVLFLLILSVLSCAARAQTAGSAERPAIISLNSGLSIVENSFTSTWQPRPSLQASIFVPFHTSSLEGGIRYMRFNGMAPTDTDSDYNSFFLHLGWFYPFQITEQYQIMPGIRFGGNLMIFDESETFERGPFRYVTDANEAEFAYELTLRNQYQITERLYLHATVSYNRTLTYFPLPLTMISGGISFSFDQPQWLKNFVQ